LRSNAGDQRLLLATGRSQYRIAGPRKKKREESIMRRLITVIAVCLLTFPALWQSTSKYQIGLITEVKPRQAAGDAASVPTSYDVSVKVGGTI